MGETRVIVASKASAEDGEKRTVAATAVSIRFDIETPELCSSINQSEGLVNSVEDQRGPGGEGSSAVGGQPIHRLIARSTSSGNGIPPSVDQCRNSQ